MQNQINTTPIAQFVQMLRAAEQTQQKEVKIPIQLAKSLSLVLVELQDKLLQDYEILLKELKTASSAEVVTISLDGGGFDNK